MIFNVDTKDHNLFCLSKRRLRSEESVFVSQMDSV